MQSATFNFSPFPILITERLTLRRISVYDAADYYWLRRDANAMHYIEKPKPNSFHDIFLKIDQIEDGINSNTAIGWAISITGKGNMIGAIGYHRAYPEHFSAEVGYMLHPDYWRQGIMQEALHAVLKYGFEKMQLKRIEALINPDNHASGQILLKNGFVKEGLHRLNNYFEGNFSDTEIYALYASE